MSTPSLDPTLLYFFVLGPGTGESVLLRVPPDKWIVIDSFANAERPAAERIIQSLGGAVSALVLTHPHQDHCMGFIELIDENPAAIVGCVHPREDLQGTGIPVDPIDLLIKSGRRQPTSEFGNCGRLM